ncbi:MAG: RagB/SusD family nutrient uptake outer membrane protein [Salinivirgaceae bacterium]|nr:RagB/SusD family nutrient uptake outer membrane protein [Salinivirgaceae bacterium]
MKKILFFVIIVTFSSISCTDYLEEDYVSGENSATITKTEMGMEQLVAASYIGLRVWYGKENQWDLTESGTDLYTRGLDNRSGGFCTYSGWVGEEQNRMAAMWYELYAALNTCNLALREIDAAPYEDPALQLNRKGELQFLRAHYLWLIVENWGSVHFTLEPVEEAVHTANRTSIETFYNQIFIDLEAALDNVPVDAEYGRITEAVTKAFLARTHLMWASYNKTGLTIQGTEFVAVDAATSQEHYENALEYANDVINNYSYSLVADWKQIWGIDYIKNNEVVWATIYSSHADYTTSNLVDPWDLAESDSDDDLEDLLYDNAYAIQREGGHQGHLMWEIRYENLSWGMVRDLENGRGFQRWMPTKFFIDLYDENVDQRFFGSFKNVWYANLPEENIPKWKPWMYVDGEKIDLPQEKWAKPMFQSGDTCIYFSKTPVPSNLKAKFDPNDLYSFHREKGYIIIDINDMYNADGSPNDVGINRQYYYPITKKYEDSTRAELAQAYSKRDAFVIRISELYLIAAEAALETGDAGTSYNYLLELANNRAINGDGAAMLAGYNVNSSADVDIDFLLDERARELATEGLRFWDLKRTGKLVERVQKYNHDANAIKDFHALRFIPQEQLDAVRNIDEFIQNPGY